MSNTITGNEPAMPSSVTCNENGIYTGADAPLSGGGNGLTIRQHACIEMELPETGIEWLDELIKKKQRNTHAAMAMSGMLAAPNGWASITDMPELSKRSVALADALIAALNK